MENEKNQASSDLITFTNITTSTDASCIFTITDSSFNYSIDNNSNDWVFIDDSSFSSSIIYTSPYHELEEAKQQQEKEEELRKENSCLQEVWNEYQLILKLLEENECDKFVEKRYGMKK